MAQWVLTIGAPDFLSTSLVRWDSIGGIGADAVIDTSFVVGGAEAWLRYFQLRGLHPTFLPAVLWTSSTQGGVPQAGGPELVSAWEASPEAIVLAAGGLSLTIPGPAHSSNQNADSAEPYTWRSSATVLQEIVDFLVAYNALTGAQRDVTTITLNAPGAPDTPAAPTFDTATQSSLRINWVAPDDGGDPITSYDLQYREQGTAAWTDVFDETGLNYTATGLDDGTIYEAQVRATNSIGDSAYSASGTGTTVKDLVPSAPSVADQEAEVGEAVSLTLPVGTGGNVPLSYEVSNLPAGLTFNVMTRLISGSPTTAQTRTVTYTVTDVDGDSDGVTFDFVIVAAIPALVLSDFDTAGLQVDFAALLEASGTENLYADVDRGGTDMPVDGELGLSNTESAISRVRWIMAADRLIFNDDDNPNIFDIGAYFSSGGDGNDLTIYLVTADGAASFGCGGSFLETGGNHFFRWNLDPTIDFVALLNGIAIGGPVYLGRSTANAPCPSCCWCISAGRRSISEGGGGKAGANAPCPSCCWCISAGRRSISEGGGRQSGGQRPLSVVLLVYLCGQAFHL